MTKLKTIFAKPVDRQIEGVIKADDEASLRLEIEEYVLTNEVEKRLESFLDAYNNYEGANGVWVSGFFGSGKSHLLKMLALLLENRKIDNATTLDLFISKCADNEVLRADLKRAAAIPSKSILFNIDQKADVISKAQIDALLAVFVKVFDEMCGYYGKLGHIAQFERDLDSRGQYEKFKTAYEKIAGKTWFKGREQSLLESKSIANAYAQATDGDETTAIGILDKYASQYRVSIEDFAAQVLAYIERQSPNFRLNFFVDEVGQYIAENVKLMTNLQTIAESLATKCRGRAWVIVTSQNDMSTVIGDLNEQQSNDFSKIMARFANKMLLTSTNVSEVIQKRLLAKTTEGVDAVSDLFHRHSNNFGTLFSFADGSREYKTYADRDEFIRCYPFIPYQFDLFQSSIEDLSRHNAFEGKHSSVGERSMLGVFQQVAIHIGDLELGQLASFDLMYEGINTSLKAQTQRTILAAERQLNSTFAIRLLKTLFLVKYVKAFKPTLHNICVLMIEGFNQDIPGLRKKVEEALSLLEQQVYVQRNGDLYEYLTDEEKDVEIEIKNTDVETSDVSDELEKIIFDHVIKSRKIRFDGSATNNQGQDYSYSRKLDDRLHGREYELAINIISPFHEHTGNEQMLRTNSTYKADELFVVMPSDDRLVRDILMYKRTEKYIRQNISITQQDAIKRILQDKGFQNRERFAELQQRVQGLIGKSKVFVAGSEIDINAADAQTKVIRGFHELISRAYPNLRMLRGVTYTEDMIKIILSDKNSTLFGTDAMALAESEQELLAFIQSNNRGGVRTTLKSLLEKFERKPYGWYFAAVLCILANLCTRGKVEVRTDGNLLDEDELDRALRNTSSHVNLVLEPQVEFTASQVRALKDFYGDFFDGPPDSNEAKALGKEVSVALNALINQLTALSSQATQYPFLNILKPLIEQLKDLAGKPYSWYLSELVSHEDTLITMKEGVIEPIRKFMNGPQKEVFDNARKFIRAQEPNFSYIDSDDADLISQSLDNPECFKGVHMQELKSQIESLQKNIATQVKAEITKATQSIDTLKIRLTGMSEFASLDNEKQSQILSSFNETSSAVENQELIAVIRDKQRRFQEEEYPLILARIAESSLPMPYIPVSPSAGAGATQSEIAPIQPKIEYVSSRNVIVMFDKAWLADEQDVEKYIEAMRKGLLEEILKGKRVQI